MASCQSPWIDADLDPLRELAGYFCENDPVPRINTFADHVDQVPRSVGVLGLSCMRVPAEYGVSTFVHEALMVEQQCRVLSPPRAGA